MKTILKNISSTVSANHVEEMSWFATSVLNLISKFNTMNYLVDIYVENDIKYLELTVNIEDQTITHMIAMDIEKKLCESSLTYETVSCDDEKAIIVIEIPKES